MHQLPETASHRTGAATTGGLFSSGLGSGGCSLGSSGSGSTIGGIGGPSGSVGSGLRGVGSRFGVGVIAVSLVRPAEPVVPEETAKSCVAFRPVPLKAHGTDAMARIAV
jgi:hypothetical protein